LILRQEIERNPVLTGLAFERKGAFFISNGEIAPVQAEFRQIFTQPVGIIAGLLFEAGHTEQFTARIGK